MFFGGNFYEDYSKVKVESPSIKEKEPQLSMLDMIPLMQKNTIYDRSFHQGK